jgi:hypothetical protein
LRGTRITTPGQGTVSRRPRLMMVTTIVRWMPEATSRGRFATRSIGTGVGAWGSAASPLLEVVSPRRWQRELRWKSVESTSSVVSQKSRSGNQSGRRGRAAPGRQSDPSCPPHTNSPFSDPSSRLRDRWPRRDRPRARRALARRVPRVEGDRAEHQGRMAFGPRPREANRALLPRAHGDGRLSCPCRVRRVRPRPRRLRRSAVYVCMQARATVLRDGDYCVIHDHADAHWSVV